MRDAVLLGEGALKQIPPYHAQHDPEYPKPREPHSHSAMPDSIVAQPAPHQHSSSQRERARRTHPHQHGDMPRVPGDPNAYRTHYGTGTAPPACTAVRACSRKGTVHTQLAVVSRRCPTAWLPYGQPWPISDVGVRGLRRLHAVCTLIGRPPAMHDLPYEARVGSPPYTCHRLRSRAVDQGRGDVPGSGPSNDVAELADIVSV